MERRCHSYTFFHIGLSFANASLSRSGGFGVLPRCMAILAVLSRRRAWSAMLATCARVSQPSCALLLCSASAFRAAPNAVGYGSKARVLAIPTHPADID